MVRLFITVWAAFLLVHCAYPQFSDLKPTGFAKEIQQYRAARNDPDTSVRAKAHYRLATLYSHHNNPSPDYHLALKELEDFIALDPRRGAADEVRDRLALLRELEKSGSELRDARARNVQLLKENKELKDTLEKIERLDIMIEEKRKQR